jgi:osmotically inducible protein OsmC
LTEHFLACRGQFHGGFDKTPPRAIFRFETKLQQQELFMADIQRYAQAHWSGDLRSGSGKTSTNSGVLRDVPYSVPSRFENAKGTNPEELLAAAHASCFSMMLAKILGDQKITAKDIITKAALSLGQRDGAWKITKVHLETEVAAEALNAETLKRAADEAKEQCPVSVLLKPGLEAITLEVRLKGG